MSSHDRYTSYLRQNDQRSLSAAQLRRLRKKYRRQFGVFRENV